MRVDVFRVPHWFKVRFKVTGVDVVLRRPNETHLLNILNGAQAGLFQADISKDFIEGTPPTPYRPAELELVIRRVLFDYIRRACTISTYRHPLFDIELLEYELIADPLPPIPPKAFTGPGPTELIGQTDGDGFYGEVPYNQLISGDELLNRLGLEPGIMPLNIGGPVIGSEHNQEPWLKFKLGDKTLFVAKKPYYPMSYYELYKANAITGNRIIKIGQHQYRIKLLRAFREDVEGDALFDWDYNDPEQTHGSEWNRLMYRVLIDHYDPDYQKHSQVGPNWVNYEPEELGLPGYGSSVSKASVAREIAFDTYNLARGGVSPSTVYRHVIYHADGFWRPVLELIDPSNPGEDAPRVDSFDFGSFDTQFEPTTETLFGPGSKVMLSYDIPDQGDNNFFGFMGEVPANELIDGVSLAQIIGLEAGQPQHNNEPWLKFMTRDGVMYVAKKNYRILRFVDLIEVGALLGHRTLIIGDHEYQLHLLSGTHDDVYLGEDSGVMPNLLNPIETDASNTPVLMGYDLDWGVGSSWNEFMYRITAEHRNPAFQKRSEKRYNFANYGQDELNITYGLGSLSWTQSALFYNNDYSRVILRGRNAVTALWMADIESNILAGWRPVLVKMPPEPSEPR